MEIRDYFGRHKGRKRLDEIIAALVELGRVRVERESTDGRPVHRVIVLQEAA